MLSISEIIDIAIQIEKNGEKTYRDAIEKVSSSSLASLLIWLADEEVKHVEWFEELKQTAGKAPVDPLLEEMGKKVLTAALGHQAFSLEEVNFSNISEIKKLLNVAIEFERDTVLFYKMIQTFIQEEKVQELLNLIINEENRHILVLQQFQDKGLKNIPKDLNPE